MNKKIFIAEKKDLKEKHLIRKYFDVLKEEIILFLDKEEKIIIFSSICPHFGGEIYYDKNEDILRCSWHDWKFCKNSGKCLSYPIRGKLNPYAFEIDPNKLKKYSYSIEDDNIYLNHE
jgi:nitrite reductase/ring-hydroxylating ferredoxin subunit|tara:strand:+ start:138 stop:491 length:354 start_codon:yes stop_codon:yes gene_type:complete